MNKYTTKEKKTIVFNGLTDKGVKVSFTENVNDVSDREIEKMIDTRRHLITRSIEGRGNTMITFGQKQINPAKFVWTEIFAQKDFFNDYS